MPIPKSVSDAKVLALLARRRERRAAFVRLNAPASIIREADRLVEEARVAHHDRIRANPPGQ